MPMEVLGTTLELNKGGKSCNWEPIEAKDSHEECTDTDTISGIGTLLVLVKSALIP